MQDVVERRDEHVKLKIRFFEIVMATVLTETKLKTRKRRMQWNWIFYLWPMIN